MSKPTYSEFKQVMRHYDAIVANDPLARIARESARAWGHLILSVVGIAVMLGNFFQPSAGAEAHHPIWLALAAVFLVLVVFDGVKLFRTTAAQALLAEELWRLKQEGAKDPMDMFYLLGGIEGWKQRVAAEEAENAAIKRAAG